MSLRTSNSNSAVFFDYCGRPCRVWRPRDAPPPPPRTPSHRSASNNDKQHLVSSTIQSMQFPLQQCTNSYRDASEEDAPPYLAIAPKRTLPVGHLLPRGRDGIDGVLQQAREAQQLLNTLQSRRLTGERRARQRQLAKDLDDQREYKRMAQLAEYQEELVHIYGPSMKHIIADTFFDDGSDPVVSFLRKERATTLPAGGPQTEGSAWHSARARHIARSRGSEAFDSWEVGPQHGGAVEILSSDDPTAVLGRQREVLHRALDDHRNGRRQPY